MKIWSAEIKELNQIYQTIKGTNPQLENELGKLVTTDDENMLLVYSRRCLEVIITELCEQELKRHRGTEPLQRIIDKLNKEEIVSHNIIVSMQNVNSMSTFGAHPKDFEPEQVKPVLHNLKTIIKWHLKLKGIEIPVVSISENVFTVKNKSEDVFRLEKSIAILPFRNDSPNEENTYFINGIMEEILNNLQRIRELRVISRTSVEQYRNLGKPIPEIAKELGVNYIVEGSGQKYGSNFRLRAQLIKAEHESHLWGESFQQNITEVEDIFNIQIKIAKSIATELKAVISPEEKRLIEKIPDTDFSVFDDYLKARSYWTDFTRESISKALEYLNSAIEKNPTWAPLYAGLAELWMWIQQAGWEEPSVAAPKIFENLDKAMELDPDLAEVHYLNGAIAQLVEWDWEKSEKEFLKSLALNPNNPLSRLMYAQLLLILQRKKEALAQSELAIRLDPLNPSTKMLYSGTLVQLGNFKAGLSVAEELVKDNPEDLNANTMIEIAAYGLMEYDKVIGAVRHVLSFMIEEHDYEGIMRIYKESGIVSAYEEIMKHMEQYSKNNPVSAIDLAYRYLMANQPEKAMDWIEKGFENHDPQATYITATGGFFKQLYENPGFIAICEKMNLPIPKTD